MTNRPPSARWLANRVAHARGAVAAWAEQRDSWPRRQVISLLDPARTELPGLLVLGALLVGSLWLFFGVMQDLIAGDPLVHADRAVSHLLLSLRVDWAAQLATGLSELGNGFAALAITGTAILWLDHRRAWRAMAYTVAAVLGAIIFSAGLDVALLRPQPLFHDPGWGLLPFPGAHLAVFAALLGFLAVPICREIRFRSRIAVVLTIVVFVASLAVSRLYLDAEYLSTVLEALAFGIAWAALLSIAYLARPIETVRPFALAAVMATVLAGTGLVSIAIGHRADMRRYALTPTDRTISMTAWLHGGWASLPSQRLTLFGAFARPFTVQWLGPIAVLRADLLRQGWMMPPAWRFSILPALLASNPDPASLPVLPSLQSGRTDALTMIKIRTPNKIGETIPPGERLVFRLWRSDVLIPTANGAARPLWIGTVTAERIARMASLVNIPQDTHNVDNPLNRLAAAIPGAIFVQRRSVPATDRWHGATVLAFAP